MLQILRIFKYLKKKEWGFFAVAIVFIVVQTGLELKLPDYMSSITQLVQTEGSKMSEILRYGGYMLLCALGSMLSAVVTGWFVAHIAAGLSATLREGVYKQTLAFSMEEINEFSTASLINRTTNDITQVQMVVAMGLQIVIKAPVMAVWAIFKIMGKAWQWTAATAAGVVALLVVFAIIILLAMPKFRMVQSLTDDVNRVTREQLTGLRVVRAYNAEHYQEEKFEAANEKLKKTNLFAQRVMSILQPSITTIQSVLGLAIYWIGAIVIEAAGLEEKISLFSDMVVFSSYSMMIIMAFMMLAIIFVMMPRAAVSAGRILEVLDKEIRIQDGTQTDGAADVKGEIEFKNVSFSYPDASEPVISGINFTAKRGETVAFIGATGSGKSTLVNLIPRFYDVTEGEVLVDGRDVRTYRQSALRKKIGDATMLIVAQRIGTIRDADRIIVLEDGKIAGTGTHEELMKTCETYQAIARSQLSEEELNHA